MNHPFLKEWAAWQPNHRPYLLPGDDSFLNESHRIAVYSSPREYIESDSFNDWDDSKLHLGLHPMPMLGNLARAKVVFLLLNPGLTPCDYFAESDNKAYWQALRRSTLQQLDGDEYPFLFLNPEFSWHSGFSWWTKKLKPILREMGGRDERRGDALRRLSQSIANIELYPYHSRKFRYSKGIGKLRSPTLAKEYVHEVLLPRARAGKVLLVAMRRAREWGLPVDQSLVHSFDARLARGAHLSVLDEGIGRDIVRFLQ